ncbi:MAG: hypothetical protein CUN53_11160 [Phototrophicales bacterium]|nr:MAG: hypothetical protein CUN53_11160 [Phototrophicales bacterium]
MLAEAPLDASEIERVRLATYGYATRPIFRVDPNPPSGQVAGLSIRVATAVALTRGKAAPEDIAHWDDPEVRRLRQLIDVEVDPEIEAHYPDINGCKLEVTLKSGEVRQSYVRYMKGEPENRMNVDELKAKFHALTTNLFSAEYVERIYDVCDRLETLSGPRPVVEMMISEPVLRG